MHSIAPALEGRCGLVSTRFDYHTDRYLDYKHSPRNSAGIRQWWKGASWSLVVASRGRRLVVWVSYPASRDPPEAPRSVRQGYCQRKRDPAPSPLNFRSLSSQDQREGFMAKQRGFGFAEPERVGLSYDAILERVDRHGTWLKAFHLSPLKIAAVLSRPEEYWRRVVKVRNGKQRVCWVPSPLLADAQQKFASWLSKYVEYDRPWNIGRIRQAFGKGDSIIRNAARHRRNRSSWCLDLENAFETITARHIERYLKRRAPFHLHLWMRPDYYPLRGASRNQSREERRRIKDIWERDLAWIISRLWTFRGKLRQGAASSPLVFNALMARFDWVIVEKVGYLVPDESESTWKVHSMPVVYTRYGDDLCFSSPEDSFPREIKELVMATVRAQGFRFNPRKFREGRNGILEFPGVVVVNGRLRPTGAYIARLVEQTPSMTPATRSGHRGFLHQFGTAGNMPVIRKLLS